MIRLAVVIYSLSSLLLLFNNNLILASDGSDNDISHETSPLVYSTTLLVNKTVVEFSPTSETHQLQHHPHQHHHHHHQQTHNAPRIDGDQMVNATLNKKIMLTCIVHNVKHYKITWYFGGILLTLNNIRVKDDKRYSIENPQLNVWRLTIDPVEPSNEGYYSCRLSNGMKRQMYLKVGVPPKFTGNEGTHKVEISTLERQNVTLSCESEGNPIPTISWYRSKKLIGTGPHLQLRNITRHSHSEYECVARNGIEPDSSRHFTINVNFKPIVEIMYHLKENNKNILIKDGKPGDDISHQLVDGELQLVCEIHGNPINSIKWFKDGTLLKDGSGKQHVSLLSAPKSQQQQQRRTVSITNTQINSRKYQSKLQLKNVDSTNNGIYECAVNGLDGDVSKKIFISDINKDGGGGARVNTLPESTLVKSPSSKQPQHQQQKFNDDNIISDSDDDLQQQGTGGQLALNGGNQIMESINVLGRDARSNKTTYEESSKLSEYNASSLNRVKSSTITYSLAFLAIVHVFLFQLITAN